MSKTLEITLNKLNEIIEKQAERTKEFETALREFGNHKDNCAYRQGLRASVIEKCDCGFEQTVKAPAASERR